MVRVLEAVAPYANTIIVFFTIALVVTTVIYTWVTSKLLRQTKNAFLADMIVTFVGIHLEEMKETFLGKSKSERVESLMRECIREAYINTIIAAFGVVDKKLAKKIDKIMSVGLREAERALQGKKKELIKTMKKEILKRGEEL